MLFLTICPQILSKILQSRNMTIIRKYDEQFRHKNPFQNSLFLCPKMFCLTQQLKIFSGLNKFEIKVNGQEAVRATMGITLLISNGDIDDVIKIFLK